MLRDIADEDEDADLITRAKWLRAAAGHHTRMANKLIMVVRYMENKTGDAQRAAEMRLLSYKTCRRVQRNTGKTEQQGKLSQTQKDPIEKCWLNEASKEKGQEARHRELQANIQIDEVQKLGSEAKEAMEHFETCDLSNVIHAAKITRLGEAHKQKTPGLCCQSQR